MYRTKIEEDYIVRNLTAVKEKLPFDADGMTYRQMSLFDDVNFDQALVVKEMGG